MKKIIYIFLIATSPVISQVFSYDFYTFRINNMFNVNPAYAGKDDGINVVLSAQTQNKGVNYANKNFMAGVYSKITQRQAVGGKIISDTRGAFQMLKADLSYAYIAKINDASSLSMGLSAGILNNNLMVNRIENYQALDQTDPTLTRSYYNTTQFSAGLGLLYKYKALDVSFSMPHIINTNQAINSYINGAVFYTFNAGSNFKIMPWLCYQNIPVTKSVGSLYVKSTFLDMIWVQAGYQTNQSIQAMLGANLENLSFGYGFRFNNSKFTTISSGIHEITIGYKILTKNNKPNVANKTESPSGLNDIIVRLDRLASQDVTDQNRSLLREELEGIKKQLLSSELDNSSPEKAEEVSKQLKLIDEKLKIIEDKLKK